MLEIVSQLLDFGFKIVEFGLGPDNPFHSSAGCTDDPSL